MKLKFRKTLIAAIFVGAIALFWLLVAHLLSYMSMRRVTIRMTEMLMNHGTLSINYVIENKGRNKIWVCTKAVANSNKVAEENYRVTFNKITRNLVFKKMNYNPGFFQKLEEPVWSEYTLLSPGATAHGSIISALPVATPATNSNNPFAENAAKKIELEIGVYPTALEVMNTKYFLQPTMKPQSIWVNCFYNKPEAIRTESMRSVPVLSD